MDKEQANVLAKSIADARTTADAALALSQHLLLWMALDQDDPVEWLKESCDALNDHIDEKTKGGDTAKWAAVRKILSDASQKIANEIASQAK